MKRIAALLLTLAVLFSVAGCGSKPNGTCPQCSAKVDFAAQAYCPNCGYAFSSVKPDGYREEIPSSPEKKGVSEGQVHADLLSEGIYLESIADDVTYKISHNVDSDTHTDTATVTMKMFSSFGTQTQVLAMQYQYYKSDDLWEMVTYDEVSCHFEANANAFLGYWSITESDSFNIDKWEYVLRIYEFDGTDADVELIKYTKDNIEHIYEGYTELELEEYSENSFYTFDDSELGLFVLDIGGVRYPGFQGRYMDFSAL